MTEIFPVVVDSVPYFCLIYIYIFPNSSADEAIMIYLELTEGSVFNDYIEILQHDGSTLLEQRHGGKDY